MARKTSPDPFLARIVPHLVAFYIRLVRHTLRWRIEGEDHHRALIDSGQPFICAFWHSRLLMMPVLQKVQNRPFAMLISDHRDGELIARVMDSFDIDTRRGSAADPRKPEKNKGGAAALKALKRALDEGYNVGITPDGPRGPRQRAQAGIAQLSRLTSAPVLPVSYSVRRGKNFSSWDRFLLPLPLPFTKAVFVFGEPIYPAEGRKTETEWLRQQIEDSLNRITELADREMNRESPAPAPLRRLEEAEIQ